VRKLVIIAGAPKSYTSSVVSSLVGRNNIGFVKEQHFFLRSVSTQFLKNRSTKDFSNYLKKAFVSKGLYVDASMTYFTEPLCEKKVELAKSFFDKIDVYCFLRNPVERILSCYNMDISNGWVFRDLSWYLSRELTGLKNSYGAGPRYIQESLYFENISSLKGVFGNLNIVMVEELSSGWWFSDLPKVALSKTNSFSHLAAPRWISKIKEIPIIRSIIMRMGSKLKTIFKDAVYKRIEKVCVDLDPDVIKLLRDDAKLLESLLAPAQVAIVRKWFNSYE
jgi:hypothetical protein